MIQHIKIMHVQVSCVAFYLESRMKIWSALLYVVIIMLYKTAWRAYTQLYSTRIIHVCLTLYNYSVVHHFIIITY